MNRIEITARLTKDPEVTYSSAGVCITKFSVAENLYDKQTKERVPQFFNVVAFGKVAETIGNTLNKGRKIHLGGHIEFKKYTAKDGLEKIWTQVVLKDFEYCDKKEKTA